jgi:hypothetical protein
VQLVRDANPLRRQVRSSFLEQREHCRVILNGHRCRVTVQGGDAHSSGSVDHVGLASAATR